MDKILKLSDLYLKSSLNVDDECPCESGKSFKDCHGLDTNGDRKLQPPYKLNSLCEIKTNFEDADFWIVRKGSEKKVGMPTKKYSDEYIGIKIKNEAKDIIIPEYLFYLIEYLHQRGYFEQIAKGTLKLKHIEIKDIKSITIG